jgi:transglutaminase-like putative cysteine protease
MKFIFILCIIIPIIFFRQSLNSLEPAFYTIIPINFSNKVYSQEISKYRVILNNSEFTLPDTSTQKILGSTNGNPVYNITLESGNIQSNSNVKKDAYANYLSDSRLLNLDDPEILKIKFNFNNSKDIINDVEKYVYDYISNKTIGIPIISASDIIKNKSGDCTEHTVLAVSIFRSLRVPSRALVGMILSKEFGRSRNVFVYHMWAEAFVNDKWILVDATRPGQKHTNLYIALAYHHLQTEMPLLYLRAVSAMKTFSVEYVE